MKYCEVCKISVNTNKKQCPLCYDELEGEFKPELSQLYTTHRHCDNYVRKNYFLYALFMFLTVSVLSICAFINLFAAPGDWWVLVVASAIIYVWILVRHTVISRRNIFEKAVFQLAGILGIVMAANYVSGGGNWVWPYVMPAAFITTTTVILIFSAVNKKRNDYLLSMLVMLLHTIAISIILIATGVDDYKILNSINILYNTLFIIGILFFGFKTLKGNISKKLHM